MSGIRPEMPGNAPAHPLPPAQIAAEVTAMNCAFLDLLTDPLTPAGGSVLGLDPLLIQGLRALTPEARDELAAVPLLLADFSFPDSRQTIRYTYRVADEDPAPAWVTKVDAFANRVLTALWHFSRADFGLAGFCMGFDTQTTQRLGGLSFAELSRQAPAVCASLRARHADHPSCWPDLIRLAAAGHTEQLNAARLGVIPLTVAMQQSTGT